MAQRPTEIELIAQDAHAVRVARDIGADRVELCQALGLGGLTPSIGLIEQAVATGGSDVEVHVLLRPRGGGFHYDADELDVLARDAAAAARAGAAGIVIGCLDDHGDLDRDAVARLRDAAAGISVSAHRAIDASRDMLASLDALIELGIGRVLTSGGAPSVTAGVSRLAELVTRADDRIRIMAGGGVTAQVVPALLSAGVGAIHFSAKRAVAPAADGSAVLGLGVADTVDVELARQIATAVRAGTP